MTGRDLAVPPGQVPAVLLERLQHHQRQPPTSPVQLPAAADGPGDRYAQAALAEELARVATTPRGQRNRQLWESTRNLYNLVATGALDHREVDQALWPQPNAAGCSPRNPVRPAAPWPPAVKSAWPTPAAHDSPPAPNAPTPRCLLERSASEPRRGGEGHGRRRPAGRLKVSRGWARAAAIAEPAPTQPPRRKEFLDG